MAIKVTKGGITTEVEPLDLDFYKRTGWMVVVIDEPFATAPDAKIEVAESNPKSAPEKKPTKK